MDERSSLTGAGGATADDINRRLRTLFESMDEAFYLVEIIRDDEGKAVDLYYLEENPAAVSLVGVTAIGRRLSDVNPDFSHDWLTVVDRVASSGTVERFERYSPITKRRHAYNIFPAGTGPDHVGILSSDITERDQAREALHESEERFRAMADNAPVLIWETNQDGAISVNGHYLDFFGVGIEQVLGMGWSRFLHPDDFEGYAKAYRHAFEHRLPYSYDARFRRADGEYRWLRNTGGPVADNRFIGCSLDVTDMLVAQQALRESEERQAFLLKLSDAVRPLADPANIQGETTRLLREQLNAGWCYYVDWDLDRKLGVVLRDSAGEGLPSLAGEHDVSDVPEFLEVLAEGEALKVSDYAGYDRLSPRIRDNFTALGFRSMMVAPLVKEGRLIASLLVGDTEVRDWSAYEESLLVVVAERTWAAVERARAEDALRDSEEKYRTLFETIDEGFTIMEAVRDDTGRVVDVIYRQANQAWARLFGFEIEPGQKASEVFAFPPDAPWIETWNHVLDTGEPIREEQHIGSTDRWYNVRFSRIGDPGSSLIAAVFDDITDRKRAESDLRESEGRLARDLEATNVLQDIGNKLISKPGVNGHFNELCEAARALMRSDCASIQEYDEAGARLKLVGHVGFQPESAVFWEWVDAGVGSSCGRALDNGDRVIVPDMDRFEADAAHVEAYRKSGILSVQSTPLVARTGKIVGMMSTHWYRRDVPTAADYRFFDILARLAADFIVRVRAETALRESEERQAFLLELSDALRKADTAEEIEKAAVELLGRKLGAGRVFYATVDEGGETWSMKHDYSDGGPGGPGTYPMSDYQRRRMPDWQAGKVSRVSDSETDPYLSDEDRAAYAAFGARAAIGIPLVKGGSFAALMVINHKSPREWTDAEIALAREAAERTFAEIERARAEAALRESEGRYRLLFKALDAGFCTFEMIFAEDGEPIDFRYIEVNEGFVKQTGRRPKPGATMRETFPEAHHMWLDLYAQVARTGEAMRFVDFVGGLDRWYDVSVFPLHEDNDHLLGALFRDVTDHKRAEEAVRESEAQYRLLFDSIDDGFCSIEVLFDENGAPYDYRFLKVNPAFERQTGLIDALGKTMMSMEPKHEPFWVETYGRIVRTGRPERFEHRADALGRWFEVEAAPIGKPGENQVAVVFRDVLQKRKAEEALRESEERYRSLFESMDEAYAVVDVLKDDEGKWCDFRFVEVNPAFIHHTNMPPPVGKTATELLGTPNPRWTELYGEALDTGKALRVEESEATLGLTFDLNIFTLDRAKNRVAVLFTNITERKKAEEALRESKARLAAAFESVPAGLAALDLDGRTVIANSEYRRFLPSGVIPSREPERASRWQGWNEDGQLLDPQDWPSARALRGEAVVPGQEMLFTDDDGRTIWTNVATAPTFDQSGKVTGVVSVISDIDTRKQAEEGLQRSERHAQTLLAELQHRVRNTLAIVRSIARRTAANSDSVEEMVGHLQGRLDAFSRVQAAFTRNPENGVELMTIVEDELVAHAAKEGEQVRVKGPEVLLPMRTAEGLSLAIHELATNAVKHGALSGRGGKIAIEWKFAKADGSRELVLDWKESGVSLAEPAFGREGFGMELLRRSLPYDLQGETKVEMGPSGLHFALRMPLPTVNG